MIPIGATSMIRFIVGARHTRSSRVRGSATRQQTVVGVLSIDITNFFIGRLSNGNNHGMKAQETGQGPGTKQSKGSKQDGKFDANNRIQQSMEIVRGSIQVQIGLKKDAQGCNGGDHGHARNGE